MPFSVLFLSLMEVSVFYNDLPDDHCERPALPKLSRKLSHCRGQWWTAGAGPYGSGLHRHYLWTWWVHTLIREHSVMYQSVNADVDLMHVHVCACSTGEPWDCGQKGRSRHHPEECNRLSAQSNQWGSDHHHLAPAQSPTYTAIRSLWCGARGIQLSSTINPSETLFHFL